MRRVGSETALAQSDELKYNPQYMEERELRAHDGLGDDAMLLLALRSSHSDSAVVLDVSSGADYYAPGMAYHCLTGKDCSRALSLTSLKPEHLHADMSDATASEWNVLDAWFNKLTGKYPTVGTLRPGVQTQQTVHEANERHTVAKVDGADDEWPCEWRVVGNVDAVVDDADEWRMVDCQC
tara:strand:+ start:94 stop:636 length:543 start_codon:yes stop_codon:yes gene_type:complete